jgi:hypothetical protein
MTGVAANWDSDIKGSVGKVSIVGREGSDFVNRDVSFKLSQLKE